MPSLTPFLWFDADLAEPIEYYRSVFPDLVVVEQRSIGDDGSVFGATIEIFGQQLSLLNGGPVHANFTEAISMFVSVSTQEEVDGLWDALTADGEPGRCGWLKDRYGLSWQIVPDTLGAVLGGPDPRRAQQALDAMMQMDKLDIVGLQAAYDR